MLLQHLLLRDCPSHLQLAPLLPVNRRISIFIVVFVTVCAAGLGYTFSITPTYVATATIQVDPASTSEEAHRGGSFVADQAEALNSNEILEAVLDTIRRGHPELSSFGSVARLREVLAATPSAGTHVIQLQARGSEPAQLLELLNLWAATYLESRGTRRSVDREAAIDDARRTVESIELRVADKRRQLDEFRRRHSIVSSEREENEVAAQVKSLTGTLNEARAKLTEAESRLSTAKASAADGKPVYRAEDRAAIAQLEQRVIDLRQRLKDLELKFTPDYLAMEPSVKVMRANIKQLEHQIETARRTSEQGMLNEATNNVVTAQKNVARLEAQFNDRRKDALNFTSRFAEHKAQTTELARLEAQLGQAKERLALLERSERTREPTYELLGRPAVPERPVHPDYVRYTGYSIGGALLSALLAVLLVEFLSPRPRAAVPGYPQPIIQIAYPTLAGGTAGEPLRLAGEHVALPGSSNPPAAVLAPPLRELTVSEVHALWGAATSDGRLALAALFSGLTLAELAGLKWNAVDLEARQLTLLTPRPRLAALTPPLAQELESREPERRDSVAVATSASGGALTVDDLAGLIAAAAHDSGIDEAEEVDAETLRYTYIAFLIRQGARLSELEHVAGPIPPASFLRYRSLSPRGPGLPVSTLERVFPAFRTA